MDKKFFIFLLLILVMPFSVLGVDAILFDEDFSDVTTDMTLVDCVGEIVSVNSVAIASGYATHSVDSSSGYSGGKYYSPSFTYREGALYNFSFDYYHTNSREWHSMFFIDTTPTDNTCGNADGHYAQYNFIGGGTSVRRLYAWDTTLSSSISGILGSPALNTWYTGNYIEFNGTHARKVDAVAGDYGWEPLDTPLLSGDFSIGAYSENAVGEGTGTVRYDNFRLECTGDCVEPVEKEIIPTTSEASQGADVFVNSNNYIEIFSGTVDFDKLTNYTISATGSINGNGGNSVGECAIFVDGVNKGTSSTTAPNGQDRSFYIVSNLEEIASGTYDYSLQCRKGSTFSFDVLNSEMLVTRFTTSDLTSMNVIYGSQNKSLTSTSYEEIGDLNFTTSDELSTTLQRSILIDGSSYYEYDSTGEICLKVNVTGSDNIDYCRYGTAGSTGSGSFSTLLFNVTNQTLYDFKAYGLSSTGDGLGKVNGAVFEIIANTSEVNSVRLRDIQANLSTLQIVKSLDFVSQENDSFIGRASISAQSLTGATDGEFMLSVNGVNNKNGTIIYRDFGSANQKGIITLEFEFDDISQGNHTLNLYIATSTNPIHIDDGNLIVYPSSNIQVVENPTALLNSITTDITSYGIDDLLNMEFATGYMNFSYTSATSLTDIDLVKLNIYNASGGVVYSEENTNQGTTLLSLNSSLFIEFDANPYNFSIEVNNTVGTTSFNSYAFSFNDTVLPAITGVANFEVEQGDSVSITHVVQDEYIWSYNFTCDDYSYYESAIGLTDYTKVNTFTPNATQTCIYRVTDGHTKNKIKDFKVDKDLVTNTLSFDDHPIIFSENVKDFTWEKNFDRYNFCVEFSSKTDTFDVTLGNEWTFIGDSGYKGHFIDPSDNKWIDFESPDGYTVNKQAGNSLTIQHTEQVKDFCFNSIGELNVLEGNQTIYVVPYVTNMKPENFKEFTTTAQALTYLGLLFFWSLTYFATLTLRGRNGQVIGILNLLQMGTAFVVGLAYMGSFSGIFGFLLIMTGVTTFFFLSVRQ